MKNNFKVIETEYGMNFNCSRERTQQTTEKDDNKTEALGKATTIDAKVNKVVLESPQQIPCLLKVFFGRKQGRRCWRQSSVGKIVNLNHSG